MITSSSFFTDDMNLSLMVVILAVYRKLSKSKFVSSHDLAYITLSRLWFRDALSVTATSRFPPTRWQRQSTTCGAVVSGGGGGGWCVWCVCVCMFGCVERLGGGRRLMFSCCAVSTTAGRRQAGGWCPRGIHRNGPWGHFSVSPCGSVAVWWHLASNYFKYRRRDIDIKILRSVWKWGGESAVVLLISQWNIKAVGEL